MVEKLRDLNKIVQKPRYKEVGNWMVRHILRDWALPVTWLLLHTNITANQVTLISVLIGTLGILCLAVPGSGWFFIGALLLQIWYYLDHVDGQIARYRKTASLTGRFLDFTCHHWIHTALFFALGGHACRVTGSPFFILWGFGTSMSVLHLNLIHDVKCKTFVEKLLGKDAGASCGLTAPSPPASGNEGNATAGRTRRLFSLLYKSCEIHVVMNILTLGAFLEWPIGLHSPLRIWIFCAYGLIAPAVFFVKISNMLITQNVDQEFCAAFLDKKIPTSPHEKSSHD